MVSYSFVYLNGSESTLKLSCSIAKLRASSVLVAISWRSWNAEGAIQSTAQCSISLFSFSISFPVTVSPRNNGIAPRPRLTSSNASQLISFPPRVLYLKEWYRNTCRGRILYSELHSWWWWNSIYSQEEKQDTESSLPGKKANKTRSSLDSRRFHSLRGMSLSIRAQDRNCALVHRGMKRHHPDSWDPGRESVTRSHH